MAQDVKKVSNPLTLIAIFAGVSESTAVAILPFLAKMGTPLPTQILWFVVLYPVLIVLLFFYTLWTNHIVLYAPGDYEKSSDFLDIYKAAYGAGEADGSEVKKFWKPDGRTINKENATLIHNWMKNNGFGNVSITGFVHSSDKEFIAARKRMVTELNIGD